MQLNTSGGASPARRPFPISRPARRPTQRGWRQPRRAASSPHSHSIINELSKLLIRKALAAAPQTFTVIFTVNLSGTSIGAGFRAVSRKLTFRDLSRSIDSRDHRRHLRRASVSVQESPKGAGIELLKLLPRLTFSPEILPSAPGRSGAFPQRFGWAIGVQPSPPDHRFWGHAMSSTGAGGRGNSPTTVASYAGAASRGDTLRAMSSRVAKVFRS